MPTTSLRPIDDDPYLLFDEVAELARMKPKTLRHYRASGRGPAFFKRGKWLMIRRSEAVAWIRALENDGQ
jgi:hypothetical protein